MARRPIRRELAEAVTQLQSARSTISKSCSMTTTVLPERFLRRSEPS
jgi:hypothetical protein